MNIFSISFDANRPAARRVSVPLNSQYGIACKAFRNGVELSAASISVGTTALSSSVGGGWKYGTFQSDEDMGQFEYPVTVSADGWTGTFRLVVSQDDFGRFEVGGEGGGGGPTGDYYTKGEVNDLLSEKADEGELTAYATAESLTAYQPAGDYLTAVPDTYRTYDSTKQDLSADGYVMDGQLTAYVDKGTYPDEVTLSGTYADSTTFSFKVAAKVL